MIQILTCCALIGECIVIHFAIRALKNHIKLQEWRLKDIEDTNNKP